MPLDSEISCCCAIGGQIAGDSAVDLIHQLHGGPYVRRILAETPRLAVIPSLGALTFGHVLVVPREHRRSWASASPGERGSLLEILDLLSEELERQTEAPVHIFEHGSSAGGNSIACSVEHAHLHLVPADVDIWSGLVERLRWRELSHLEELPYAVGGSEYLLYCPPGGVAHLSLHGEGMIPSQLLRRVLAESLIEANWDWRSEPRLDLVERTFRELHPVLSEALSQVAVVS
jgi:ATP adenylyltransferase